MQQEKQQLRQLLQRKRLTRSPHALLPPYPPPFLHSARPHPVAAWQFWSRWGRGEWGGARCTSWNSCSKETLLIYIFAAHEICSSRERSRGRGRVGLEAGLKAGAGAEPEAGGRVGSTRWVRAKAMGIKIACALKYATAGRRLGLARGRGVGVPQRERG